jgi:hypothetical protein
MWVWVQDPLQRLSLLAMLVDSARGVKGGCLASVVGAHLRHGDPFVVGLVKRIMRKVGELEQRGAIRSGWSLIAARSAGHMPRCVPSKCSNERSCHPALLSFV